MSKRLKRICTITVDAVVGANAVLTSSIYPTPYDVVVAYFIRPAAGVSANLTVFYWGGSTGNASQFEAIQANSINTVALGLGAIALGFVIGNMPGGKPDTSVQASFGLPATGNATLNASIAAAWPAAANRYSSTLGASFPAMVAGSNIPASIAPFSAFGVAFSAANAGPATVEFYGMSY